MEVRKPPLADFQLGPRPISTGPFGLRLRRANFPRAYRVTWRGKLEAVAGPPKMTVSLLYTAATHPRRRAALRLRCPAR